MIIMKATGISQASLITQPHNAVQVSAVRMERMINFEFLVLGGTGGMGDRKRPQGRGCRHVTAMPYPRLEISTMS